MQLQDLCFVEMNTEYEKELYNHSSPFAGFFCSHVKDFKILIILLNSQISKVKKLKWSHIKSKYKKLKLWAKLLLSKIAIFAHLLSKIMEMVNHKKWKLWDKKLWQLKK